MKNVIITGASSGFGKLSTLTLARKGYKVWATMRNLNNQNRENKEELLSISKSENLNIEVIDLDVTDQESVDKAIKTVIDADGKIDTLVNNAGLMYVGIAEAYSLEQVKYQFDVNFYGVLRTVNAVLPHMRKIKNGLIINVTSVAGRLNFPHFSIYGASKHALESYSESLSYEVAPFGVEVKIVEPGPFGGTNLLYSGPKEANTEIFDAYGEHKNTPKTILDNLNNFYKSDDALDPQIVADAIVKLIKTPKGEKDMRVVSGLDYGTIDLNERLAKAQTKLVESLEMGHLLEVK
ncbi:SDR family oxidoreductase [Flavobacteriaceae bacterium AH-315-B10]|nr:SDR family oxidoreductase [Flavobacteriaceae bacterium AH-315-B10]